MGVKRGPYAVGIDRRRAIIDAALELVKEHGYEAVTVKMVADAVGITRPGVLHHFESRDDIMIAVLDEWDKRRIELAGEGRGLQRFSAAVALNTGSPRLVELVNAFAARAVDPASPAHEFFVQKYRVYGAELTQTLRRLQDEGTVARSVDTAVMASVILAAAEGLQARWLVERDLDLQRHLEALFESVAPGSFPSRRSQPA